MRWRFGSFLGSLKTAALTATRNWTFPDRSGPVVIDQGPAAVYNTVVSVTGSKTFALTDIGTVQDCTNGSAATLTIPLNSTVAFPIGTVIYISKRTTLNVSIGAVGGVTVQSDGTTAAVTPIAVISSMTLRKVATDTWKAIQDCSPTGKYTTLSQTTPAQARVNRTAAYTLTAVTSAQKLDYDTIVSQSPASSISNSGRYTVTAANTGIYAIEILFAASSSAVCTLTMAVTLNGAVHRIVNIWPNAAPGGAVYMKGNCHVHMGTAGDYVEVTITSNAATNLTVTVGPTISYFDITKIA